MALSTMTLDLWLNTVVMVLLQNNCMHELVLVMNSEDVQCSWEPRGKCLA